MDQCCQIPNGSVLSVWLLCLECVRLVCSAIDFVSAMLVVGMTHGCSPVCLFMERGFEKCGFTVNELLKAGIVDGVRLLL